MSGKKLTQPEMILISMHRASSGTTKKIPYEELVLQAWRDFPESFSLRNYPQYPDASDLHKKLYNGSLKEGGLVLSLGDKNFRLTEKGVSQAAELLLILKGVENVQSTSEATRLSREEERFMEHALRSRPFRTWRTSGGETLTDYDARVLFQFSTGTRIADRKRKAHEAKEATRKAHAYGIDGAEQLAALIEYLASNFDSLFKEKTS